MSRKLELNRVIRALNSIKIPTPTRRYERFRLAIYPNMYYEVTGQLLKETTVSTITLIADYEEHNHKVLSWHLLME